MAGSLLDRLDRSVWLLLLVNVLTIVLAAAERWDIGEVLWIYWSQSVIIGAFNFRRILDLERFSTKGYRINDRPVEPNRATKIQTAVFFAVHYGMFHAVYAIFLAMKGNPRDIFSSGFVYACVLAFLVNHAFSYRHNRERDRANVPNIGQVMMAPYARIIPMHLVIIFGGALSGRGGGELVLFLLLKTVVDVLAHMGKHAGFKTSRERGSGENAERPA